MKTKLNKLLMNSHSPYSNIKVAAIAIANNKEFKGVNVENAAFGSTICAERSAMLSAISNGQKPGEIKELHLTSSLPKPLYPCGPCLQMISELCSDDFKLFVYYKDEVKSYKLEELLPFAINKRSFGWK